jgi:hypothetical protein
MKFEVIKDFSTNGENYIVGDELKTNNYNAIVKLNELGYIKPLSYKDLVIIRKKLNNIKNEKEGE